MYCKCYCNHVPRLTVNKNKILTFQSSRFCSAHATYECWASHKDTNKPNSILLQIPHFTYHKCHRPGAGQANQLGNYVNSTGLTWQWHRSHVMKLFWHFACHNRNNNHSQCETWSIIPVDQCLQSSANAECYSRVKLPLFSIVLKRVVGMGKPELWYC